MCDHDTAIDVSDHDTAIDVSDHDTAIDVSGHDMAIEVSDHDGPLMHVIMMLFCCYLSSRSLLFLLRLDPWDPPVRPYCLMVFRNMGTKNGRVPKP